MQQLFSSLSLTSCPIANSDEIIDPVATDRDVRLR